MIQFYGVGVIEEPAKIITEVNLTILDENLNLIITEENIQLTIEK